MTGYQSKRAAAQDKLNDDDTQVYGDALTIAYQSGYYDGKKAAQRKPLTLHQIHKALISICYDGSEPTSTDDPEFVELIVPLARAIEAAHDIKENT
jgi:hypothetical protein